MGRNTIDLDKINARLGNNNKAQGNDPDEDNSDLVERDEEEVGGALSGTTFFGVIIGLFLLVGAGIFFMPNDVGWSTIANLSGINHSGPPTANLRSSVDGECKLNEWVKDTHNNDQMHCYLTSSVSRLCNSSERQALVALILRYQNEADAYETNLQLAVFGMQMTPLADRMQMGVEAAKADNSSNSEEAQKHERNAQAMANKMMAGPNAIIARQKYMHWNEFDFQANLKALGEKGFITLQDFPSDRPQWVTDALQNVKVTTETCKT
ncbi:MAG: hypothetical protein M3O03_04320 [Pseudomonadota bacterium]|nr:hypothetical protein [Pseudomonadota bacterium]